MNSQLITFKVMRWIFVATAMGIFYNLSNVTALANESSAYEIPENEVRKLEAFINLTSSPTSAPLTAPDSIERARDDFMDAWMERTYTLTNEDALENYRRKITIESSITDKMLLKVFENALAFWEIHGNNEIYVKADVVSEKGHAFSTLDALSSFDLTDIPIEVKLYAYIIDTHISVSLNWFESGWKAHQKVYSLANKLDVIDPAIAYEISQADLFLFAMGGDYSRAVSAAINHVNIGRKTGRGTSNYAVINNVLAALANAGAIEESLFLLDYYENYTQNSNAEMKFTALYAKGLGMKHLERFDEAIELFEKALQNATNVETRHMVFGKLFVAYAGAGKISDAQQAKQQHIETRRQNSKPTLLDIEGLKQGEYLISLQNPSGTSLELYQDYIKTHMERQKQRRRRMLNFSSYHTSALENIIEEQKLEIKKARAENSTTLGSTPYMWLAAGLFIFFGLLGYLLHLKKLQAVREVYEGSARASRVKGQFLNLIGHNSRTTLSAIESMVQALKNSSVSLEHLPTVQVIGSQASQLGKAITDLIFSARVISGDRKPQPSLFNPFDFKSSMLPAWQKDVGKRKVSVSFDIPPGLPMLMVDKIYLQTAVNHLVQEAIHRTRAGKIDIEFSIESSIRGPMLLVSVEDTGEGISEEELGVETDIFEVDENGISISDFSQRLGYSIVKSAVKVLGGTLTINTTQASGSHVHFCVPVTEATASSAANDSGMENIIPETA